MRDSKEGELDMIALNDSEMTKMVAVAKKWIKRARGQFTAPSFAKECKINDVQIRDNILGELVEGKLIEQDGSRNGVYHRIDNGLIEMDWQNAVAEEYPILMPLNLHEQAVISPGNVVLIAGETNAGKTAYVLNLIHRNLNINGGAHGEINCFNSEMHPKELKGRVLNIDSNVQNWTGFRAYSRSRDFHSVINPNGFNVIDYMENLDNFWKVGEKIEQIHNTLQDGIAVICLQKKTGEMFARGGEFTQEKARLSISLFSDNYVSYCRITKCKMPRGTHNPQGMERDFEVVRGAEIRGLTPWEYMNKEERENRTQGYEDQAKIAAASNMSQDNFF
ncbi:MAG: hypothetical protein GY751_19610 [Bacteroidetes bacterium]|nr:hypothetical protein [Bacteroidota bacterium]